MSSFVCSVNHFKKVRENTIYFLNAYKYKKFTIGLDYNTNDDDMIKFVDNEIYNLIKNNIASYNLQYNENVKMDDYRGIFKEDIKEFTYYKNNINAMIGLYNAYKCINYQIELKYDNTFINNITRALSSVIIDYLCDYKTICISENANMWEYKQEFIEEV